MQNDVIRNSTNIENLSKQQNRIESKVDSLQKVVITEMFILLSSIITLLIKALG